MSKVSINGFNNLCLKRETVEFADIQDIVTHYSITFYSTSQKTQTNKQSNTDCDFHYGNAPA